MKRRIVTCDFAPITCERVPAAVYRVPFLFSAFMTAIRASISGPSRSATSNSASICDLPIGRIMLGFRQRGDVFGGVAQRQQLAPVGQNDGVNEPLEPSH